MAQPDLFQTPALFPEGFLHEPELIGPPEQSRLVAEMDRLTYVPFDFHGFEGKRRVVSFGWRYDFGGGGLQHASEIPAFLLPVRDMAAVRFHREPEAFQQVLLTEYRPGAPIGWHRDRSVFGDVIGISLLSSCTFRFRKKEGSKWLRHSLRLHPGSAYLLSGPARTEWEHSIPPVEERRYSITFRTLKGRT